MSVNVVFINAFLESLLNTLSTMARTEATHQSPSIKKSIVASGDVTGIIGIKSAKISGSISISFSERSIKDISSKMIGEKPKNIDDTVKDLVAEITNMVSGGAKQILSEAGYDFSMTTPAVTSGENHEIHHHCTGKVIQIPFKSDAGEFYIEASFQD